MKQFAIYIILSIMMLFASCSSVSDLDDSAINLPTDDEWLEETLDGPSVTIKPFTPGDAISRSSLVFGYQNLIFGWNKDGGDKLGLYPTAKDAAQVETKDGLLDPEIEANRHVSYTSENQLWRTNPATAQQWAFTTAKPNGNSQTVKISNDDPNFKWDEIVRWSAYYPYKNVDIDKETYVSRTFDFTNQEQDGIVNISAYKKGTAGSAAGEENTDYVLSEITACAHLGKNDVMISPEVSWSNTWIHFQMRHVGAVIRLYLLAPKENLILDDVKLICESKIFYEKGAFSLLSHPYNANAADGNYGVNLDLTSPNCQIWPCPEVEPTKQPTNMLQLKFKPGTAKTVYDSNDSYKRYVTAYLMTFPIKYDPDVHGELYAYVTAHKQGDDTEYHFVSKPLEAKDMKSGHYYQWTSSTHADDGLYPIELTATLLPWQDIVGAGIETDLEK